MVGLGSLILALTSDLQELKGWSKSSSEKKSRKDGQSRENGPQHPEASRDLHWSSYKGLTVDTLAHRGDEGRGYLR